ncbi:MAG TPA: hypothetical protein VK066_02350 [Chloroflexota bacterium]|nr:hypothetical protein [Chloroflexota bacterium]
MSSSVLEQLDCAREVQRAGLVGPRARPPLGLQLSRRGYWLLAATILVAYLVLWLSHFEYVYGWIMDDQLVYSKTMATIADWTKAFRYEHNILQPYFFLISYLPLKSGISLPSYVMPLFGEHTGQFRFFLLYTVCLHALLLGVWAWVATALVRNRVVALLSLLLFASSPSVVLWSPQPESRLLGLPFALAGLWLLLRVDDGRSRSAQALGGTFFVAGSLFWVAQSIHYTALYLVAPLAVVYAAVYLWRNRSRARSWLGVASLAIGCVWLQGVLEAVSYWIVGIPRANGPLMTLLNLRAFHESQFFSMTGNLALWAEWFRSQMGPLLLVAVGVGWVAYLVSTRSHDTGQIGRLAISVTVLLALVYLGLSGSEPFFRQTSVLQPFLFLFAGAALVGLARRLARPRGLPVVALGALVVVLGATQWGQARAVFDGHQGLGRAITAAAAHNSGHQPEWLSWVGLDSRLSRPEDIARLPVDAWLLSYFPQEFVSNHPSMRPYLESTAAVAAWPSLFATQTVRAETEAFFYHDFPSDPDLRDVRLLEAGELLAAMNGQPLRVDAVTADSMESPSTEPVNVFDQSRSPDSTIWLSADTPGPHFLAVQFTAPASLGSVQVVQPESARVSRISALEVQVADESGAWHTVWIGDGLDPSPVIAARWEPRPTTGVKLVIHRQGYLWAPANQVGIEEVVFPGYTVEPPRPQRTLPPLVLDQLQPYGTDGILVTGKNLTPRTAIVLDGQELPTRWIPPGTQLLSVAPEVTQSSEPRREVYLVDYLRRSEALTWPPVPPVLRQIEPTWTLVGTPFNTQPEGSSLLEIDAEDATPATVALLDGVKLPTTYQGPQHLTATVPGELLASPGQHAVTLQNAVATSSPLPFVVSPRTVPVARALDPADTIVAAPFHGQPDGRSLLAVESQDATPDTAVLFDDVPLETQYENDQHLLALVPLEVLSQPGTHTVKLRNLLGTSDALPFMVTENTTGRPVLKGIEPGTARVDTPFDAQADGTSVLRVTGEQITPDTAVVLSSVMLATEYVDDHTLLARVPREFLAYPVRQVITLRNSLGTSNSFDLVVEP